MKHAGERIGRGIVDRQDVGASHSRGALKDGGADGGICVQADHRHAVAEESHLARAARAEEERGVVCRTECRGTAGLKGAAIDGHDSRSRIGAAEHQSAAVDGRGPGITFEAAEHLRAGTRLDQRKDSGAVGQDAAEGAGTIVLAHRERVVGRVGVNPAVSTQTLDGGARRVGVVEAFTDIHRRVGQGHIGVGQVAGTIGSEL